MAPMSNVAASVSTDVSVLGVSIPVPEPFGEDLQARRRSYGDPLADSVPAHVTLLGPTEVRPGELGAVLAHLEQAARRVAPFTMVLQGTGSFRPVSSVVFVQVAEGKLACRRLEQAIRSGPYNNGLPFPYHPHVTIAHDVEEPALDRALDEMAGYRASFTVRDFLLYEQDQEGQWAPIHRFRLGDGHGR